MFCRVWERVWGSGTCLFCRVWGGGTVHTCFVGFGRGFLDMVHTCFVGFGRGFWNIVHTCFVGFGRGFWNMVHTCFVGFVEVIHACFDSVGKQVMKWSVIMHNVFVRNFKYV